MGKIKFEINDIMLYADSDVISRSGGVGGITVLNFTHFQVIELLHQYIKGVAVLTDSILLADVSWEMRDIDDTVCISVYLSDGEGRCISDYTYTMISKFSESFDTVSKEFFESGKYTYTKRNIVKKTTAGTPIITNCYCIDIFDYPAYGSIPFLINKIRDMIKTPRDDKILTLNDMFDLLKEFFDEDNILAAIHHIRVNNY